MHITLESLGLWDFAHRSKLKKLENITFMKLALSKGHHRVGVSLPSPKEGNRVSETLCSLVFRIRDDVQSP
jgi:hypothetical protein